MQGTVRAAAETTTKLMIIETRGLKPLQTVRATSLSFQWNFSFHSALRAGTLCIQKSTDNLKRNLEKIDGSAVKSRIQSLLWAKAVWLWPDKVSDSVRPSCWSNSVLENAGPTTVCTRETENSTADGEMLSEGRDIPSFWRCCVGE